MAKRVGQAPTADQPAAPDEDAAADDDDAGAGAVDDAAVTPPGLAPPGVATPGPAQPTVQVVSPPTIGVSVGISDREWRDSLYLRDSAPPLFTVTGSLIERPTRTTPSPLTVLTREDLLATGRSMIGDILQPLPEQGNAINAQFNNGGDGSTRISLRGLGVDRTLTLLDGRRFVSVGTGVDSTVDLNTIPLAAIERVEVLKDAGSSVYGSDAVGGVVNIITRSSFTGTEASLYTAQTSRKDGFSIDTSFITGHRLDGGRGNVIFSAGMQRQEPVFAGDRAFSEFDKTFNFQTGTVTNGGSTATPSGRINARQIDVNGDGRGDTVNICGAGVTFCTNDGMGGFRPFVAPADLFNFQPDNFLYTPSSRVNAYSAGTFKLMPDVAGFFQMSFLHRESSQRLAADPFIAAAPISRNSIFNPFGGDVLQYNRRLQEFGPRLFSQNVDTFRMVAGLQGSVPADVAALSTWKWELSFNLGRTSATEKDQGHLVRSRLRAALGPSFINASGVPTCGTPTAPIPGCVPMNILGPAGSISPEAVAFASFTGESIGLDEQRVLLAQAHGRIVRLPSNGDISLAFGTDIHDETGEFTPDALIASGDTDALSLPVTSGSTRRLESFAEVSIVPARDRMGRERLEIDLAARTFRSETFGSGTSWNARALIRPIPILALRAANALAFHVPTISDLFRGNADTFPIAPDPCDHIMRAPTKLSTVDEQCAKQGVPPDARFGTIQQHVIQHGNRGLEAETAKVATAGAVLEPAPGVSASIDFWKIDVAQQIRPLDINVIFNNCYQRGIQEFCDLVHRDPTRGFAIDFVDSPTFNLGGTSTSGFDAAVDVQRTTPGMGQLRATFEAQHLFKFDVDNTVRVLHGLGNYDLGVYPTLKANLAASWRHRSGFTAGFNLQFVGDYLECDQNDCNDGNLSRTVDAYQKVDVFTSFPVGQMTVAMGVNNVFDRDPPTIFVGFQGDSDAATYNYLGQFFWARISQRF